MLLLPGNLLVLGDLNFLMLSIQGELTGKILSTLTASEANF
jgi:hypothetical protein